jgi:outer membrane protein TolC
MMKKYILIFLFFGLIMQLKSQSVTLQMCRDSAVSNYPNLRQILLNSEAYELNIKNIKTNYYPKLNLNGQASYQSDVTKIPEFPFPSLDVPEISKDWYKINLDIEQMIYDGGVTSGQQKVETAKYEISDQKVQVELFQLKEHINQLYFNILFLRKNIEVLEVLHQNLQTRIKDATVAHENGMLLSSDVDALQVELYRAEQKITEKKEDLVALVATLSELTRLNIPTADDLIVPEIKLESYDFVNNRPEYMLLDKQQSQVMALKSLTKARRIPVLMAFGQAGYGRPGYDMLNDNFDDYYMVGIRLHWNIWDWGKTKREKQVFDIQNNIINAQKETFNQNLRADLHKRIADIEKYEKIIGRDEEIVRLQKNVVETADRQLKNGTITSTGYLIELNKMTEAKLNLEAHKLQLIYAKYQYLTSVGNL